MQGVGGGRRRALQRAPDRSHYRRSLSIQSKRCRQVLFPFFSFLQKMAKEEVARVVVDHDSGTYRAYMDEHGSLVSVSRVSGVAKQFSPVLRLCAVHGWVPPTTSRRLRFFFFFKKKKKKKKENRDHDREQLVKEPRVFTRLLQRSCCLPSRRSCNSRVWDVMGDMHRHHPVVRAWFKGTWRGFLTSFFRC